MNVGAGAQLYGNVIKGWEGWTNRTQDRRGRKFKDSDRLFSYSSCTQPRSPPHPSHPCPYQSVYPTIIPSFYVALLLRIRAPPLRSPLNRTRTLTSTPTTATKGTFECLTPDNVSNHLFYFNCMNFNRQTKPQKVQCPLPPSQASLTTKWIDYFCLNAHRSHEMKVRLKPIPNPPSQVEYISANDVPANRRHPSQVD